MIMTQIFYPALKKCNISSKQWTSSKIDHPYLPHINANLSLRPNNANVWCFICLFIWTNNLRIRSCPNMTHKGLFLWANQDFLRPTLAMRETQLSEGWRIWLLTTDYSPVTWQSENLKNLPARHIRVHYSVTRANRCTLKSFHQRVGQNFFW